MPVLTRAAEGWHIQDLGSTNGTFVNNHRVTDGPLKPGDHIRIGLTCFQLGRPA